MNRKHLNQQFKAAIRRVKDYVFRSRRKRREQWVHIGEQIGLIHAQLSESKQASAENQRFANQAGQSAELAQQTADLAHQSVQRLVQQMERQHLKSLDESALQLDKQRVQFQAIHQRIDRLALNSEQIQAHVQQSDAARNQRHDTMQMQLEHQAQAITRAFDHANRLEVRLLELEKEMILGKEPVAANQSRLEVLQSTLEATQLRAAEAETQREANLEAVRQQSLALQQQLDQIHQQVSTLQQTAQTQHKSQPSAQQRVLHGMARARAVQQASANNQSRFCTAAFDYYANLDLDSPFIYLDVKSVPRSGLHYLQRVLQNVLGKSLSFCEWYQEPGCCKQMPCAVTGFAQACCNLGSFGVRMIKSHDFDLQDPIFPTNRALRRIVLVRDPVYCLTSYWNLQALKHNQQLLKAHGINPVKVDYLHEKPVLQMAYRLIDEQGSVPAAADLIQFLEQTKKYMLGFFAKWGRHVPAESIISYEQINEFATSFLEALIPRLSNDSLERLAGMKSNPELAFQSRENPFSSVSEKLSRHLAEHAELFQRYAEEIKLEDEWGWFARCGRNPLDSETADRGPDSEQLRIAS